MTRYRDQLAAAVDAVAIRGPTRYAWLGRPSRPLDPAVAAALDAPGRRRFLVGCLRDELYCSFYRHGVPVVARWGEPEPVAADPALVDALARANTGRGGWDGGWTAERRAGADVVVARDGVRVRVPAGDCRTAPGGTCVRLPSALPSLAPGYWTAVSDAATGAAMWERALRVYWNVGRAGAPALVAALTGRLNAAGVAFRLKVADHPFRLERCDAAVLYLPGDAYGALATPLRELAAAAAPWLRPGIPAFTYELAPGVGLAEDDGGRQSFGERRCALLAEALVHCDEHGLVARVDAVAARLAAAGLDLDAPYREPSLAGRHVL